MGIGMITFLWLAKNRLQGRYSLLLANPLMPFNHFLLLESCLFYKGCWWCYLICVKYVYIEAHIKDLISWEDQKKKSVNKIQSFMVISHHRISLFSLIQPGMQNTLYLTKFIGMMWDLLLNRKQFMNVLWICTVYLFFILRQLSHCVL
jgi:hypothetical protein